MLGHCPLRASEEHQDPKLPLTVISKSKLMRQGLGKQTAEWVESWLGHQMPRGIFSSQNSRWWLATSSIPQGSVLAPMVWNNFIY